MIKTKDRIDRVWENLANPSSKDIAASEWLLLFTIYKAKSICYEQLGKALYQNWKAVNKEKNNFFIVWSTGYDIHRELIRYSHIGILRVSGAKRESPCWAITSKGADVLREWKREVSSVLGDFANKQKLDLPSSGA